MIVVIYFPQHFLYFLPLPHGQGAFLPILSFTNEECPGYNSGRGLERFSLKPNRISTSSKSPVTVRSTHFLL